TVALVHAGTDDDVALDSAADAGVIEIEDGRIRFAHPLFASGIVARLDPERLRLLHRRLAGVVRDTEQRARHLALGADVEDVEAATALDQAARLARARGAPEAAAELLDRGLLHTPVGDAETRAERLIAASEAARDAGDWRRALARANEAATLLPPGQGRARALLLVGETSDDIAALEQGP